MTETYPSEYQYSVLVRLGTAKDRSAWFKENNIRDFKRMIFSNEQYFIFKHREDALKFKVVWG